MANELAYLGPRHGLTPRDAAGRAWVQLALPLGDFVNEIHDTHRPLTAKLYARASRKESENCSVLTIAASAGLQSGGLF